MGELTRMPCITSTRRPAPAPTPAPVLTVAQAADLVEVGAPDLIDVAVAQVHAGLETLRLGTEARRTLARVPPHVLRAALLVRLARREQIT